MSKWNVPVFIDVNHSKSTVYIYEPALITFSEQRIKCFIVILIAENKIY